MVTQTRRQNKWPAPALNSFHILLRLTKKSNIMRVSILRTMKYLHISVKGKCSYYGRKKITVDEVYLFSLINQNTSLQSTTKIHRHKSEISYFLPNFVNTSI